jgi:hypothetical protein
VRTNYRLNTQGRFSGGCKARRARGTLGATLSRVKETIRNEFAPVIGQNERLLRLALNEAEAIASQTAFPHLVFPALAEEKAQSIAQWSARQRLISKAALLMQHQQRTGPGQAATHDN